MNSVYPMESLCEVFSAACDQFESLICELQSGRTTQMKHGQVEALIREMGTELLRVLFQAHSDLRAVREARREDMKGADGALLPHCRNNCQCNFMTLFGEVVVRRKGYSAPGVKSVFPSEAELNLAQDKYSHGLRRRVAEEVGCRSFDHAVAAIEKTTGGEVPERQTEEVTVRAAQDFEAFYSARQTEGPEPTSDIPVMSADQKGLKAVLSPSATAAFTDRYSAHPFSPAPERHPGPAQD